MIMYLLLFLLLVSSHIVSCLRFFDNHKRWKLVISVLIPIIVLIVLSTIKSNSVGNDTWGYSRQYYYVRELADPMHSTALANYEIGFRFIFISFSKIGLPFKFFQLFIYSIIYGLLGYILYKESKYPAFALTIFCLWSWLLFDFSALRQGLSDMLVFFAAFLLTRKPNNKALIVLKYVVAAIIIVGSYFIHRSSVAFIAIFGIYLFIRFLPESFRKILLIISLCIPIIFFLSPEIYQFFFYMVTRNSYIPKDRSGIGGLFYLYFLILIFALLFSANNRISLFINNLGDKIASKIKFKNSFLLEANSGTKDISEYTLFCISLFAIGVGIQSFSGVCDVALRFANPYLMAGFIIIPNVINFNKSKLVRITAMIAVVVVFIFLFYIDYYRPNYLHGFPYTIGEF